MKASMKTKGDRFLKWLLIEFDSYKIHGALQTKNSRNVKKLGVGAARSLSTE